MLFLLLTTPLLPALCQVDWDGDGRKDLLYFREEPNGALRWWFQKDGSATAVDIGIFGQSDDLVHVGYWTSRTSPERALFKKLNQDELRLFTEKDPDGFTIDIAAQDTTAIIGRDITSNGLADTVVLLRRKRVWEWRFVLDPFSDDGRRYKLSQFGKTKSLPFPSSSEVEDGRNVLLFSSPVEANGGQVSFTAV